MAGAQIAETSGAEVAFESRAQINLPAKRAIGEAAYQMLRPETSVFLDAGTTVLQLARRLRPNPIPLPLFMNFLPVAQVLMPVAEIGVTLLGGSLRRQNASMVGPLAEAALEKLWFGQLFLGVGGISDNGGISSRDEQEARIKALMLTRRKAPVIVADADKFGPQLTYGVAHLGAGMQVLSDVRLGVGWRDVLEGLGCVVTVAEVA